MLTQHWITSSLYATQCLGDVREISMARTISVVVGREEEVNHEVNSSSPRAFHVLEEQWRIYSDTTGKRNRFIPRSRTTVASTARRNVVNKTPGLKLM